MSCILCLDHELFRDGSSQIDYILAQKNEFLNSKEDLLWGNVIL